MKTSLPGCMAVLLLAMASPAAAQNIFKCSRGGQVEYTDRPCPHGSGEVIHQADDGEVIDQYLRLGQDALARRYAEAHHLDALYQQRVEARQQALDDKAQLDEQQALAAQQRDEETQQQAQQQAIVDEAANRARLQVENETLRQQNEQYRDELAQPTDNVPYYGGFAPPIYRDHPHDHDHDHDHDHGGGHHPPPAKPVFHPCTQLAGGRVQC